MADFRSLFQQRPEVITLPGPFPQKEVLMTTYHADDVTNEPRKDAVGPPEVSPTHFDGITPEPKTVAAPKSSTKAKAESK